MARELLAIFHGGQGDGANRDNSGALLSLLGVIFLSLSVISMIIFSCGADDNHMQRRRRKRGISGMGGDGDGAGAGDLGGASSGDGGGGGC